MKLKPRGCVFLTQDAESYGSGTGLILCTNLFAPKLARSTITVEGAGPPAQKPPSIPAGLDRTDWMCRLFSLAVAIACLLNERCRPFSFQSMDFWFEADTLREISNMTRVHDDHYRTSDASLISLLTFVPVYLIKHGLSVSPLRAVLLVGSLVGGLWAAHAHVLFRLLGCRKPDAIVLTLLGLVSASALFWLPVPTSYSWGSLSIAGARVDALYTEQRQSQGSERLRGCQRADVDFTVTNWMVGLLVSLARWPWKQAAAAVRQCAVPGGDPVGRAEDHLSFGGVFIGQRKRPPS